jgi:DMSO/TMAO reductase YedYZ molybdopterin-dependent catalytic subunit
MWQRIRVEVCPDEGRAMRSNPLRRQANDLAADTASHRLNFLAVRLNGMEIPPKRPAIRRMSD